MQDNRFRKKSVSRGSDRNTSVIVIGAGLAGLTLGYRLAKQGMNVRLFEARSRPGGRVFTVLLNGKPVELGGRSLTDGGAAPHIKALAAELGLKVETVRRYFAPSYYDHQAKRTFSLFRDLMPQAEDVFVALEDLSLPKRELSSESFSEVLDSLFVCHPILRKFYETWMRSYEGLDTRFLDPSEALRSFKMLTRLAKTNYQLAKVGEEPFYEDEIIQGGAGNLVLSLTGVLKDRIVYDSPITRVRLLDNGSYQVDFENGCYLADIVVFAIPASLFKSMEVDSKVIPPKKLKIFSKIKYAAATKVEVPISAPVLEHGSLMTQHGFFWFEPNQGSMVFYYTGSRSETMELHQLAHQFRQDIGIVRETYPDIQILGGAGLSCPHRDLFSNHDRAIMIPWMNESFSQGAYSVHSWKGCSDKQELIQFFGESVLKPFQPEGTTVFFLGEHTSLTFPGTLEGAVESAERTARMIINSGDEYSI